MGSWRVGSGDDISDLVLIWRRRRSMRQLDGLYGRVLWSTRPLLSQVWLAGLVQRSL